MSYFFPPHVNLLFECLHNYVVGEWYEFTGDDSSLDYWTVTQFNNEYRKFIEFHLFSIPSALGYPNSVGDFKQIAYNPRKTERQHTGMFGEGFVALLLAFNCMDLGTVQTEIDTDNQFRFRTVEDQDPVDMAFKINYLGETVYVYVCMKNSTSAKVNTKPSSPAFMETMANVIQLPRPTLIIRIRGYDFDLQNPMGSRYSLRVMIQSNFEIVNGEFRRLALF